MRISKKIARYRKYSHCKLCFFLLCFLMVMFAVKNDDSNCRYIHSEEYTGKAVKRGLAGREEVTKRSKRFMIPCKLKTEMFS